MPMMNEPVQGLPYPSPDLPPDGPVQIKALAEAAALGLVMRFPSAAARDVALAGKAIDGMLCHLASDNGYYVRISGAWRLLWRNDFAALVQRGTVTISAGATQGAAVVTFPSQFPANPSVVATAGGTAQWSVFTSARTAAGVTINVIRIGGSAPTASVTVDWIAAHG